MTCPICHGPMNRLFAHQDYWILGCEVCRHRSAEIAPRANHVEHIYDDKYFQGGGAGYSDYLVDARILRTHGQRYGRMLSRYMKPGTVLDVGAAAGFLLKGFLDQGWRGEGIEPNPRMAEYARTHLKLDVATGTLEEFESERQYDVVSLIQVVAHFVDPERALQVAALRTRQGGFWLIETWNRESWTARAFGKHWHEYSPPSVLHWFSPEGLRRLASQFGFREVARGRPSKWIGGEHAKSLLRYRLEGSRLGRVLAGAVSLIPDRLALPYPAEDLFWTLYQKSS
ncbi:MAG TPA: class I SAM-dependent methyltransferase [Pyrinomonadaceae bacterium]|nr:class I SAM-dependent methyltransferase [Pyrinomonadaceae bacterium]